MAKHINKDWTKGQIDVYLLWRVLQGNIIKIVVVAMVLAAALGLYRYTNAVPTYSLDVRFIVTGVAYDNKTNSVVSSTSTNYGASLAVTSPYIITEDRTVASMIEYLRNEYKVEGTYDNVNRSAVRSALSISVENNIVTVRVRGVNKQTVTDVAMAVESAVPDSMDYYFGVPNASELEGVARVAKPLTNFTGEDGTNVTSTADEYIKVTGRNTVMYAGIGFMIGAVLVYILCLLRTYFDNTIYNEEDLKERFNIPVVGQIPTWENTKVGQDAFKDKSRRDRAKAGKDGKNPDGGNLMSDRDYDGRLLNKTTPFAISEAFKTLRTNLCYTTRGEKCAVYGVTSAYVSAGKSLIIANLAVSFSQMEKKVLLIDGDLRCPVQHKIFGLDNKVHGLSDVLAGICSYDELYRRNGGYENLNIITSGKIPPNPAELLASENMKRFVERIREEYDVVFIDLPPVCEVSDAGIISELVTGYAFVIRSGYSDRRMIEIAVELMDGFDANFVGFVLNDIDIKSGEYYKNKYYNSYSKYRFRYGKSGYYRNHKYGYYQGYYRRNRYATAAYEQNSPNNRYANSYSKAYETVANAEETKNTDEVVEDRNELPLNDESVLAAPVEEILLEETPVEAVPDEAVPSEEAPAAETFVEEISSEEAPAAETPVEDTPILKEALAEEVPAAQTPIEADLAVEESNKEAPVEEAPVGEASAEKVPTEAKATVEDNAPFRSEIEAE